MKKFILKGTVFFLFILGLSYTLDYLIQEGLKTSNYREVTKWNEVIQGGIDAQILIVGSSRALVHFDCEYIHKVTGKTCYNLGFDGTTYPLQKIMLELYLSKNRNPERVIWSLDYHTFSYSSDFYGFEQLVPYMDNSYIRRMLSLHENPNYEFFIPVFRYSYNPKMKVIGLYSFLGKFSSNQTIVKGFRSQRKVWDGTFDEFKTNNPKGINEKIQIELLDEFSSFSLLLIEQGIDLHWIISPYYYEANNYINNSQSILISIKVRSDSLGIKLLDYSDSEFSKSKIFFYNGQHLNSVGVLNFMNLFLEVD